MIQATTKSPISAALSTEDNRIDTSVASTQIRFLIKFINDMDGSVDYAYAIMGLGIYDRYTSMSFTAVNPPGTPNIYNGEVYLIPAGHWKYEVYEVSWIGTVTL